MKILIIAEWFYPADEIAAVRPTQLYKYWKRAGHLVNVITMNKQFVKPILPTSEIDDTDIFKMDAKTWLDKYYDKYKLIQPQKMYSKNYKKESFITRYIKNMIARRYFAGKQNSWKNNCVKFIQSMDFDYDVVFSSFGPSTTLKLGRAIKQKHPHVKWIADFRDQPDRKYHSQIPLFFKSHWIKRLCRKSDLITCVSNGVLLQTLPKSLKSKASVITNGYDPDMLNGIISNPSSNKLIFAYSGTIYKEDNFDCFFKVVNELVSEGKINKDKIAVNYAGRDARILLEQASRFGFDTIVESYGLIPKKSALQIQLDAHVLLFVTWNIQKRQGMLKGKIFEQMMMNKPILGFINGKVKNSESKELFDRTGIGFCYEYATNNYDDLKSYVFDLYNQWTSKGKIRYDRNQDEVDKYNYKNIAAQILKELK